MKFFKHGVACFGLSLTLISQADEKMTPPTLENDPEMLWAEEVLGQKALSWVNTENKRTVDILEKSPLYKTLKSEAEKLLTSKERIPYGSVRNGFVYNFWQDDTNLSLIHI